MALRAIVVLACLALAQAELLELSCEQVRAFVDGHNSRRLEVARGRVPRQPPAADMKKMVWDGELAAKAAAWAEQNEFSHNPDKTVDSERFTTGENLYLFSTTSQDATLDPDQAVQSWFDEHEDFTFGELQNSDFESGPMIGHYTQMVWADSTRLGCAISEYWDDDDMNNFLVVCNYGPAGNYIGEAPYKKAERGVSKLACDAGAACRRPYGKRCLEP